MDNNSPRHQLQELRIVMIGQKTSGKTATGNTLLHKEVFPTCQTENCQVDQGEVAGRRITVIDTPGWWGESSRIFLVPVQPTFVVRNETNKVNCTQTVCKAVSHMVRPLFSHMFSAICNLFWDKISLFQQQ
uniref:AIG1-type G domain-containing protein n=1 Tax=Seriola dumerili TaxID=41447 RepID=A0A3B4VLZ8_SERDU